MKYKQCNVNVSVPRCPRRRGCLHPGQLHRWCLPWRYRPCGPRRSRRGPRCRPRPRAPRPRGDRILRNPPWRQGSPRWTRCPRTPGGRCRRPGTQRPPIQGPPPSSPCRWARPPGRSPRRARRAVGILRQLLNGILQHNHNNQQQHCLQGEVCGVFSNTLILQSGAQELPCNLIFSIKNPAYLSQHQQQLGSSEEQCIQHPFSVPWKMQTLIQDQTFNIQRDGGYRKKSHCDFLMTIYTREWYYFLRGRCGQMLFIRKGWRVNCPIYLRSPHHKTRSLNPTTNWTPV